MKKFVFVLILTMNWLISNGQTGPVFQYTHPSKQTLLGLALSETIEGSVYRNYLVDKINLGLRDTTLRVSNSNISSIFDHLFLEEVYLEEGSYDNSGYDPSKKRMNPSLGHKWTGFAWVFRIGTYTIILIKEDCGNILTVQVIRKVIFVPQPRPEPRPEPSPIPDWRTYQAPRKVYPNQAPLIPVFVPIVFKQRTWVGKHIVPIVIAFVATSATIYVVANHDRHHDVIPPTVEPRTMPPGIPAVPVVPTPGVPSDPRTMPPGTGFVPHTNFGGGITIFRF